MAHSAASADVMNEVKGKREMMVERKEDKRGERISELPLLANIAF